MVLYHVYGTIGGIIELVKSAYEVCEVFIEIERDIVMQRIDVQQLVSVEHYGFKVLQLLDEVVKSSNVIELDEHEDVIVLSEV